MKGLQMKVKIYVTIFSLFSLISFAIPSTAYTQDWVFVTRDADGGDHYIDRDSVTRKGAIVEIWSKFIGSKPQIEPSNGSTYLSSKSWETYDCEEKTRAIKQIIKYSDANFDNRVYSISFYDRQLDLSHVIPGSNDETLFNYVCKLSPQ